MYIGRDSIAGSQTFARTYAKNFVMLRRWIAECNQVFPCETYIRIATGLKHRVITKQLLLVIGINPALGLIVMMNDGVRPAQRMNVLDPGKIGETQIMRD